MELKDKVAIVTGGNGGLGRRIAAALARAGVHIAVTYGSNRDTAADVARGLVDLAVKAEAFGCDLEDPAQIAQLAHDVEAHFGRLDILVNDAAFNKAIAFQDLDSLDLDIWNKILTTNLTAPMLLIKAVAPAMRRQGGGRIVNITSVAGFQPQGSSIAYAVSKAGLNHLTKCMAVALAPDILVNGVAPGLMEGTRMTERLTAEHVKRATANSLLGKAASKNDIAAQVVVMCQTDTMTGQTAVIDAGRVFH
jgi:3-oxoacyl-[acyl-carrier protein] reductase